MILLFFGLIICDMIIGDRTTKKIVAIIDIPVGHESLILLFLEEEYPADLLRGGLRSSIHQHIFHAVLCFVAVKSSHQRPRGC
jgi:hypothetical protein